MSAWAACGTTKAGEIGLYVTISDVSNSVATNVWNLVG